MLRIAGYAALFDVTDGAGDTIRKGAFARAGGAAPGKSRAPAAAVAAQCPAADRHGRDGGRGRAGAARPRADRSSCKPRGGDAAAADGERTQLRLPRARLATGARRAGAGGDRADRGEPGYPAAAAACAGTRSVSVSAAGIFLGSTAEDAIRAHALAGTIEDYELSFEDGARLQGRFLVQRLDYAGDFNGERNYTLQLESSGAVVPA